MMRWFSSDTISFNACEGGSLRVGKVQFVSSCWKLDIHIWSLVDCFINIMSLFFKSVFGNQMFKMHVLDDFVDRLSRQYTVILLFCLASVTVIKQLVSRPINCWCPPQFTDNHVEYANSICWESSTHYLPIQPQRDIEAASTPFTSFHQWVPLILLCQSLLSTLPYLIWRFLNKFDDINLNAVTDAVQAASTEAYHPEVREKAIMYIVNRINRYKPNQQSINNISEIFGGNYLIIGYLAIKTLYIVIAVGQLFLIDALVLHDYPLYGLAAIYKLCGGYDWSTSQRFPSVKLCDFSTRQIEHVQNYTLQCSMPVNSFFNKMYLFVWFWFLALAISNVVSLATWLTRIFYGPEQVKYVSEQLNALDAATVEPSALNTFTKKYLSRDGLFAIRLIGLNKCEFTAGDVLYRLWTKYRPRYQQSVEAPQEVMELKGSHGPLII